MSDENGKGKGGGGVSRDKPWSAKKYRYFIEELKTYKINKFSLEGLWSFFHWILNPLHVRTCNAGSELKWGGRSWTQKV